VPTHRVAADVPVWDAADPTRPAVGSLERGSEVQTLERVGEWAHVECSNGWQGWSDARAFASLTRAIPPSGLPVWSQPDPEAWPLTNVEGGQRVTVRESRDGWARVEFANGWSGWLDGRALVAPARRRVTPWPALGAALVIAGSLLPWLSAGPSDADAWDIPLWSLVDHESTAEHPKTGLVLLLVLVACIPYLTRTPLHPAVPLVLGGAAAFTTVGGFLLADSLGELVDPGIGLLVVLVGGLLLVAEPFLDARSRT
jgi:hypothetical protein